MNEAILAAIRKFLSSLRGPANRRAAAAELRRLAEEQERLADAQERVGHIVHQEIAAASPRPRGGRPRGSGELFVRWKPAEGRSGFLYISNAVERQLGMPERLDVQRLGRELHLRPAAGDDGWKVIRSSSERGGQSHLAIGQRNAEILGLMEEGRFACEIRGGAAIVVI